MICANNFHIYLIVRHIDLVRCFIYCIYILYNFGTKFKTRGGVCNIPLLRAHVIDLFFEDTCMQVIRF
jgi:hypothetical protein